MRNGLTILPETYTICMYMRLSNEDDYLPKGKDESGNITSQRRLIQNYINKHDEFKRCKIIERFDDGLSGRYFDTRPGFTEMIELCRKGKINCIIVKDCSRFGRDYVELGDYLEQIFPFLGIRFISVNDNYDSDLEEGGLDIAFKNLVYDYYSRDLSKKERIAKTRLAEQGKCGASQAMYGYRKIPGNKHSLEVDPEAAEVVKEIFSMRLKGFGPALIARELNSRGILCPTEYRLSKGLSVTHPNRKGHPGWIPSQVDAMLKNEGYTGAVISHKIMADPATGKTKCRPKEDWIIVPDMHEAIISKDEFDAVQKMRRTLNKKKRSNKKYHYRCGICGRSLRTTSANLYCCRKYDMPDSDCSRIRMKKREADEAVLKDLQGHIRTFFEERERQLKKKAEGKSPEDELKEAEAELHKVETSKRFLFEKLSDRTIDRETFRERKAEYDQEIDVLRERIMAVRELMDDESDADIDESILDKDEITDEIWEKYIESAEVFPDDRMTIKFKF